MSPEPAGTLVRVSHLPRSLAFYRDQLHCQVSWQEETAAQIIGPGDWRVLLAEAPRRDVTRYLTPVFSQPRPRGRLYFRGRDLPQVRKQWLARGLQGILWEEQEWGSRSLSVPDPDGYLVTLLEDVGLPDAQMLEFYRSGPLRLEAALTDLGEADLDLVREPGAWSIRQTVLHLVDAEATSLFPVNLALAESGRVFQGTAYNPDLWAQRLAYAHRSIQAEVQLFRAMRAYVAGLLGHLPGALDCTLRSSQGQETSVRTFISALTGHALGHIAQIWQTRRAHEK
ncbi:MAG: DinB family protein [Deinococcus sp.]|nr:DinB family protein [Deinococcus sp.]